MKVGDKFVIEIAETFGQNSYKIKGLNSVYSKDTMDKLEPFDETTAFTNGLADAWETITKIAKMPDGERMTHFGELWISNILNAYSLEQIFTILEKSESESDEIKVGDELCFVFAGGETIEPFIVFSIKDDNGKKYYEGIQVSDGRWVGGGLKYYKTGRHFPQVAELLKAMKGGED